MTTEVTAESMGFSPAIVPDAPAPTTAAAVAREEGVVRAMILMAIARPRNEYKAAEDVVSACKRIGVAKDAEYRFPRGGELVTGPSVKLSRLVAVYWGNIRSGIKIVEDTPTERQISGWAHDVQTNRMVEFEHRFSKRHQRKNRAGVTEWVVTDDEREIRELTARWGAICERNAILQLIPPDVIEGALRRSNLTKLKAAQGALEKHPEDVIRNLLHGFSKHSVTQAMVETYLGHVVKEIDPQELADLQAILAAIEDGQAQREEFFKTTAPTTSSGGIDLEAILKQEQSQVEAARAAADEAERQQAEEPIEAIQRAKEEQELADLQAILAAKQEQSQVEAAALDAQNTADMARAAADEAERQQAEEPPKEVDRGMLQASSEPMTKEQIEAIQRAKEQGLVTDYAIRRFRKLAGFGKGKPLTQEKADELLDIIDSGEIARYEKEDPRA